MKFNYLIILLILFQFGIVNAQRGYNRDIRIPFDPGKRFYSDIIILPDSSSDSLNINIFYKCTFRTLTFFLKSENGTEKYFSVPNFEVELKDSEGIIRKRIYREDTITVNSYEMSVSEEEYIYGLVTAKMKPGKYSVNATLRCANSQLVKNKIFPSMEFKNFTSESVISEPILTNSLETDVTTSVNPYLFGLGIPFSSQGASILIPVSYKNEFEKFKCNFKYTKSENANFDWGDIKQISGSIVPIPNSTLRIDFQNQLINPSLSLININSDTWSYKQGLLNIHLPSDNIFPGSYELSVIRENTKDTLKKNIFVIWEDMPVVLFDPEYAASSMYYLLTDSEYNELTDGNSKEISRKIINYWKEKDPTKSTAYNEAMAEYFKRAAYAMQNFKSKNSRDGIKTDKGKIYILYGPPTTTNKELGEKQNSEVWKYDKIKKSFIFKTDNDGNYILTNVSDIN